MILEIAVFFGVLALLVLAHEFGHFIVARSRGVRVEEFGFGFPPRLFGFQKGGTFYSFNLLPLGGFVKISGENDSASSDPKNFSSHSLQARAAILSAGVIFNIILAFIIFSSAVYIGLPIDASTPLLTAKTGGNEITVVEVLPQSAAESAGIAAGDKILSLESETGEKIIPSSISDIQAFTKNHLSQKIAVEIERGKKSKTLSAILSSSAVSPLGVAMTEIGIISAPWYKIPLVGLELTVSALWGTIKGLFFIIGLIFSGASVAGLVSGPVGIFSVVSGSLVFGLPVLMSLVAILSLNLAIINLIPIPGLDGGRLLFLVFEAARGKPVGQKVSGLAHTAGFAILIVLMAVITYLDIRSKL